jgi:hypothetical protein
VVPTTRSIWHTVRQRPVIFGCAHKLRVARRPSCIPICRPRAMSRGVAFGARHLVTLPKSNFAYRKHRKLRHACMTVVTLGKNYS